MKRSDFYPPYSARAWNNLVALLERNALIKGPDYQLRPTDDGVAVDYLPNISFHPWELQPFWDRDSGQWCCYVVPGFVNGHDPIITMPNRKIPIGSKVFGNNYGKSDLVGTTTEVKLTDDLRPFLILDGFNDPASVQADAGGVSDGSYPDFFRFLGAREPDQIDPIIIAALEEEGFAEFTGVNREFDAVRVNTLPDFSFGNRLIASCDIVLTVTRASVRSDFQQIEILGVPSAIVLQSIEIIPAQAGYGARLASVAKYLPPTQPTVEDRISGSYVEPNFEQLLIGTIWLLSPDPLVTENVQQSPDVRWSAYVENKIFWNVNFESENRIQAPVNENVLLITGLAGGLADPIFTAFLQPINDANARAAAALNNTSFKGHFWTG